MKRVYRKVIIFFMFIIPSVFAGNETTSIVKEKLSNKSLIAATRIVSLVPSYTELIKGLGEQSRLVGVTGCESFPVPDSDVTSGCLSIYRGYIINLNPDLIILTPEQAVELGDIRVNKIIVDTNLPLADSIKKQLEFSIFLGKQTQFQELINSNNRIDNALNKKTSLLKNKLRMIRVYSNENNVLGVPGDNSFENDIIKSAGGIPPAFGKVGEKVTISAEEWLRFNPEIIFTCEPLIFDDNLSHVSALQNKRVYYYPCALINSSVTNASYLPQLLAYSAYSKDFFKEEFRVSPDRILNKKTLDTGISYIKKAEVVNALLSDVTTKTLILELNKPMKVLSTLHGLVSETTFIGNHYSPPAAWGYTEEYSFQTYETAVYNMLSLDPATSRLLFTGANMDSLAVVNRSDQGLDITVFVTAGVKDNALRASKDNGSYLEPGTINIILMTNRKLTDSAMASSVINITEAKTAALWDMDIRSSQTPLYNPATGTGTDNIIVVQGDGAESEFVLGHTVMGELIAKAVYDGVTESVGKQNGYGKKRSVYYRLMERGLDFKQFTKKRDRVFASFFEIEVLRHSEFIEAAFALSDAYSMGHISGYKNFKQTALLVASEIAGRQVQELKLDNELNLPPVLNIAFQAILTGLEIKHNPRW